MFCLPYNSQNMKKGMKRYYVLSDDVVSQGRVMLLVPYEKLEIKKIKI